MKSRYFTLIAASVVILLFGVSFATADTLKLKDGTKLEGIIKKVETGKVYVLINEETKVLSILEVEAMEFNTPHLLVDSKTPIDHFMTSPEAQEMVRNIQQLDKSAEEIRRLLSQIQLYWAAKQPIDGTEERSWAAAKETFRQPLMAYQEVLNDLYFHVLARVDQYNSLMKDAAKVYVGIKGIRIGSSLVLPEMEELPLRKYVPGAWYDTIFYDGYNLGYADAVRTTTPRPNNQ
jgi:hypothetical protein